MWFIFHRTGADCPLRCAGSGAAQLFDRPRAPMDLNLWPGAVAMILFATLTASLVTTSGRSTWFVGVLAIMVYLIFAVALYLLPPAGTTD
jgi:Ca2+/H+ antiporter